MALRNGDVFYTNGLGLSGSFSGTFAYYLSSPFSLIIFLFPVEKLPTALLLIIYLKASFAAVSFAFLQRRLQGSLNLSLLLFPLCYSLMSFGFFFFINLFWLDALIWLPPLVLSVINLVETGRSGALAPLLAVLFLSNFYISYITGLFLFLLYIAAALSKPLPLKAILLRGLKLAAYAFIAACLAAVVLLPAIKDFFPALGADTFDGYGLTNFTAKQFILKLFPGCYDSIGNFAAPTIFCGTLIFILAGGFFFLRNVKRREKTAYGSLLLLMLTSFVFPQLDRVWHAFSFPNAFAYRYAFCFSFLLIFLAAKTFVNLREIPKYYFAIWLVPAVLIVLFRAKLSHNLPPCSAPLALAAILLFASLGLSLTNSKKQTVTTTVVVALVLLNLTELTLNGMLILKSMQQPGKETSYPFPLYADWADEREKLVLLLSNIEEPQFYRVAVAVDDRLNGGAALNINSVSSFSSCYSPKLQSAFNALGYKAEYKACRYQKGSPETDALFGVRYLLGKQGAKTADYTEIATQGGLALYENANRLNGGAGGVLFVAKEGIRDLLLSGSTADNLTAIKGMTVFTDEAGPEYGVEISRWEGGTIEANVHARAGSVLQTTLPYDKNYTVRVNGIKTETYETLGAFLAFPIPVGRTAVKITYIPKELIAGGAIFLISTAALRAFPLVKKQLGKKRRVELTAP